ncbi:MAG: Lrp/AsnC family transcriptional regulator [Thermoproteota archaeon]|nr:MAG: Lrp/AsnC family transcriptional regulator [Candidatus Korarchaeota archaeon]
MDSKDLRILKLIQENCKLTVRELARLVKSPATTVHSRIKKLEREGVIKGYKAIVDAGKVGFRTTAFILVSFSYNGLSQREVARKIAGIPEVQEVHIITGDWDMILKVKVRDVEELGRLVIDKLRTIEGVEKTLTCVVLDTAKETTELPLREP